MGLVTHVMAWAFINLLLVVFIASAGAVAIEEQLEPTDDELSPGAVISFADVFFIDRFKAGFDNIGLPETVKWFLAVLNGLWLAFIVIGWVRGQN